MSWTAIALLAGGAYLFKALGLLVLGPLAAGQGARGDGGGGGGRAGQGLPLRLGQLLPPALLAALVVSQTVVTDGSLTVDARLAGVTAGAVAVWRRAPFWLVLVIAAGVTAGIRQLSG